MTDARSVPGRVGRFQHVCFAGRSVHDEGDRSEDRRLVPDHPRQREAIVVHHSKGGFQGGVLAVEVLTFMGLCSERLFACDLDGAEGRAALSRLAAAGAPPDVEPTPLAAFARYLEGAASRADLEARWEALMSGRPRMIFSSMLPAAV